MLILTLVGTISHRSNDWLVDSGEFKHMTRYKESFINMCELESRHKVKLGDDYQYPIKGSGEASYKLDYDEIFEYEICAICSRIEEEYYLHLYTR